MINKIKELLGFKKKPVYKVPKMRALRLHHQEERAALSDYILLYRFKIIRSQCKWGNRPLDTLLEYINELEYRGIKYRL